MTKLAVRHAPRLTVSKRVPALPSSHDPDREYALRYRAKKHAALPHVVKFSGGRSSGMLLFTLLESGLLDAARGDVIVFNNTSAEHPETYRFVGRCMRAARAYGIPFFAHDTRPRIVDAPWRACYAHQRTQLEMWTSAYQH